MNKYSTYKEAEDALCRKVVLTPEFITKDTLEIMGTGFVLRNPINNRNGRSRYDYAEEFFQWMMSGEKNFSENLRKLNNWAERFVSNTGLPETFSASYGWKIKEQLPTILTEVSKHRDSRRGYVSILQPQDNIILSAKTTHEYPCTIGFQIFVREDMVNMIVNMRSNNVYSVMPYDVYNMTRLQEHVADQLKLSLGYYYHQINSAHIYKGDARRLREQYFLNKNSTQ